MAYRLALAILLVSVMGCAPSLEAARARAPEATVGAAPGERDEARCDRLDNRYVTAGTIKTVALSATGADGFSTVIAAAGGAEENKDLVIGLGLGTVGGAAVGAGAGFVESHAAKRWAEECSE